MSRAPQRDTILLASLATAASLIAFLHYYRTGAILLYGDSVAHINIARRVFDSRTPGPLQLGTVWLPLPHLLMMPFLISMRLWRSGIGGSIPSMIAYVAAVLGIFRLLRDGLAKRHNARAARLAAWFGALVFGANPNLLYLQATAMTEALQLALFIWGTVFFADFVRQQRESDEGTASRALIRCGWLLLAGIFTRYDGWFAAFFFAIAAAIVVGAPAARRHLDLQTWRRPLWTFILLLAVGPAVWLGYNASVWGNPLEFANGPYSARGIEQRTTRPGDPHHPGWNNPRVAAMHFLKAAKLNLGEWRPGARTFFPVALLGAAALLIFAPQLWPWLLLWLPLPFYAISIAYGGVPIFLPPWWPFSYYNVRYGIELLPAIAVSFAAALYFGLELEWQRWIKTAIVTAAISVVAASYLTAWVQTPISLREAEVNSRSRSIVEAALAGELIRLPATGAILMYTGDHGGALERAGIPLRRTINESNYRMWQAALAAPAEHAQFVIAAEGDPVAGAVSAADPASLELLSTIRTPGQALIRIYRLRK